MQWALDPHAVMALLNLVLLAILLVVAVAIARLRSLFAIVILSGVYSLVSAVWYVAADAPDVGFTEAAVGAGVSTVILLGAMLLTARTAKAVKPQRLIAPLAVCLATGAALAYAVPDLPGFGDAASPVNTGTGRTYLEVNAYDTGIPNVVTSVLAGYRGFDTLGETIVIFAAGLGVALLLGFGERALGQTLPKSDKAVLKAQKKRRP